MPDIVVHCELCPTHLYTLYAVYYAWHTCTRCTLCTWCMFWLQWLFIHTHVRPKCYIFHIQIKMFILPSVWLFIKGLLPLSLYVVFSRCVFCLGRFIVFVQSCNVQRKSSSKSNILIWMRKKKQIWFEKELSWEMLSKLPNVLYYWCRWIRSLIFLKLELGTQLKSESLHYKN